MTSIEHEVLNVASRNKKVQTRELYFENVKVDFFFLILVLHFIGSFQVYDKKSFRKKYVDGPTYMYLGNHLARNHPEKLCFSFIIPGEPTVVPFSFHPVPIAAYRKPPLPPSSEECEGVISSSQLPPSMWLTLCQK